jgi:hydrogenase maturation factor
MSRIVSQDLVDLAIEACEKSTGGKVVIAVDPQYLMRIAEQLQEYEDEDRARFESFDERKHEMS